MDSGKNPYFGVGEDDPNYWRVGETVSPVIVIEKGRNYTASNLLPN